MKEIAFWLSVPSKHLLSAYYAQHCARNTEMDKVVMVPDQLKLKAGGENSFKYFFSIEALTN